MKTQNLKLPPRRAGNTQNLKLGVIGCGNMGRSLIEGIISEKVVSPVNIFVSDVNSSVLIRVKKKIKVRTGTNKEITKKSDVVILAVKPIRVENVLTEVKKDLNSKKVLVSIAAGVSTSKIESILSGLKIPVIRVMPNLPVKVKSGIVAYSPGKYAKEKGKIVENLFSSVGEVFKINENKMNAITAISGSGPGYIFYLAEIIGKICIQKGFSGKISRVISTNLIYGSGKMLIESCEDPETLKKMVSSPGGTTLVGLRIFEKKKFRAIFKEVVDAAEKRSRELSK